MVAISTRRRNRNRTNQLKCQYNKWLAIERKWEEYLDNSKVPYEERIKRVERFDGICRYLGNLLIAIGEHTPEEQWYGFKV